MSKLLDTTLHALKATRVEYPFGGSTKCNAFFLKRPAGNVWMYSSSRVKEYHQHIAELGGVQYQLLNHRDEASKFSNVIDAPVFCHALEKSAIERKGCKVGKTFDSASFRFGDDLVAYHTPGHSQGVSSYLWKVNDDISVLFPGDTLYVDERDQLQAGPLAFHSYPGNVQDMIESLELMKRLNPTYIVPGLSQGRSEDSFVQKFSAGRLSELIEEVKAMQH